MPILHGWVNDAGTKFHLERDEWHLYRGGARPGGEGRRVNLAPYAGKDIVIDPLPDHIDHPNRTVYHVSRIAVFEFLPDD